MRRRHRRAGWATLFIALTGAAIARADLKPDELLLLVNANAPESAALAEHYAKARNVPADRVLKLDTPSGDDLSYQEYEDKVAKPVRAYLATPAGERVRCLVTFYGLPLRVGGQPSNPADQQEAAKLKQLLADLDARAGAMAGQIDDIARSIGVSPPDLPTVNVATARLHIAETERRVQAVLANSVDPARSQAVAERLKTAQQASVAVAIEVAGLGPSAQPTVSVDELRALVAKPRDPAARQQLRDALARQTGVFGLYQVVEQQLLIVDTEESDAAVDNELALVRLADYGRYRWQLNPLNYRNAGDTVRAIMVSRIDAPTVALAHKLIDDTLATEAAGLNGKAAFDGRGLPVMKDGKPDGYGIFDQSVRDAAAFVKAKTKLTVVADDREALIPPRTVTGAAIYCGWYSLRQYVPSCTFVRGAVAYHVASFELLSLHTPGEKGWVANLLKEGVVATMGPVAEPYLASFNRPDEFFPLLLTGRPTLAEAYWATCPMTSWKQTLIGDPLYRPFAKNPAVQVNDLPTPLRLWVEKITPAPAGGR